MSQIPAFDRLRDLLGPDLQLTAGAVVTGDLPVSEVLVNRLIREHLAHGQAPVTEVRLDAYDANELTARVTLRAPAFLPPFRIAARIVGQPQFPGAPVLALQWRLAGMGLLSRMAAPLVGFFEALPPGVRLEREHLLLDVRQLLESRGLGEALRYVNGLSLTTRAGVFNLRFELRVPLPETRSTDAPSATSSSGAR